MFLEWQLGTKKDYYKEYPYLAPNQIVSKTGQAINFIACIVEFFKKGMAEKNFEDASAALHILNMCEKDEESEYKE